MAFSKEHLNTIVKESIALASILIVIGSTSAIFFHARNGIALADASPHLVKDGQAALAAAAGRGDVRQQEKKQNTKSETDAALLKVLPAKFFIADIPFSTQAPLGDWSQPYKDACEEAAVAMSVFWARKKPLDPETANREILNQAAFEDYHFGFNRDTSLKETLKLFLYHYRYKNVRLVYDIDVRDIKREIGGGNLVIVPLAGKMLANPYFKNPPDYHMIVIRGYDDDAGSFIVNEPGTAMGENFLYGYSMLYNAIHDWTGSEKEITLGQKGMIVVSPSRP